jgi:CO dehydrogenase nickel-insertion accessory protein CooC1
MAVRFDQSLPCIGKIVAEQFGREVLERSAVVRDIAGRLSIVLPSAIDQETLSRVEAIIRAELGAYARPDYVIRDSEGIGSERLLKEARTVSPFRVDGFQIRVLDRRAAGSDWLLPPEHSAICTPRIVFTSLKGGVGRSTALSVMAAYLSRRGRRVLAVDFDLEAPGLGTMLLNENELPRFGTLDYFVESGISGIDDAFWADLTGDSFLGAEGARVAVVPAIGKSTIENPSNALGKLARAYIEIPRDEGPAKGLSDKLREMIGGLERTKAYDVVLIDARAGLHETTPAAVLGLGADILLFGVDHPQTFLGYRLLMAHLAQFPVDPSDDWRDRLTFVNAKASDSVRARKDAEERFEALYELIAPPAEPELAVEPLTANEFDVVWDENALDDLDPKAFEPQPVLHVADDARYRDFNPLVDTSLLESPTYTAAFSDLLKYADRIIEQQMSDAP